MLISPNAAIDHRVLIVDALRQAAESLAKAEASKTLAREVQGVAERAQPDLSAMLGTSTRLRARLQASAKQEIHHWFE